MEQNFRSLSLVIMKAAVQYALKTRDFLTLHAFKEHY